MSFWTKGGIGQKVDPSRPLIVGHEASGTAHEIGSAVSSLKLGDNITIEPGLPFRRCLHCKRGRYNLCSQVFFAADSPFSHGTLRKYFKLVSNFMLQVNLNNLWLRPIGRGFLLSTTSVSELGRRRLGRAFGSCSACLPFGRNWTWAGRRSLRIKNYRPSLRCSFKVYGSSKDYNRRWQCQSIGVLSKDR